MFVKAAHQNCIREEWWICLPESMVLEVRSLCHQSEIRGHSELKGRLNKFLKGFCMLSARQKICFLNGRCDTCLTKEQSMPVRTKKHVPSLTGYIEKQYGDLVSMSKTIRGNRYMLTVEDSFSRYCRVYPIPKNVEHMVAKVLMDQHFNVYGFPDQLHSDNGKEFLNNLWRELFS